MKSRMSGVSLSPNPAPSSRFHNRSPSPPPFQRSRNDSESPSRKHKLRNRRNLVGFFRPRSPRRACLFIATLLLVTFYVLTITDNPSSDGNLRSSSPSSRISRLQARLFTDPDYTTGTGQYAMKALFRPSKPAAPVEVNWRESLKGREFAIYDNTTYHDEVHGAVIETLRQFDGVSIRLYKWGWRWGFERIVADFWGYEEPCLDPFFPTAKTPRGIGNFWEDLKVHKKDEATDRHARKSITDVIFTTCDIDFDDERAVRLEEEWLRRPDGEKFRLLCFRHWANPGDTDLTDFFLRHNAVTHLGLGDMMRDIYANHISSHLPAQSVVNAPAAETYIPVFKASGLLDLELATGKKFRLPMQRGEGWEWSFRPSKTTRIDSAAMQGNLGEDHRAMNRTLTELFQHITDAPGLWGYHPPTESYPYYKSFEVDGAFPDRPKAFKLHLVGNWLPEIPVEFTEIVYKHERIDYEAYFRILNGADIMLPAFHDNSEYINTKASSTVGVAGSLRTVLLTDDATANAYGYFCPVFEARRPPGVSEIEYIYKTRSGQILWDRRFRSPGNLMRCQEQWQVDNGKMFARVLNKPFFKGDEDWKATLDS